VVLVSINAEGNPSQIRLDQSPSSFRGVTDLIPSSEKVSFNLMHFSILELFPPIYRTTLANGKRSFLIDCDLLRSPIDLICLCNIP